ncbi:MAG: radical SAM protein [Deltaproteobacteria bacterium]|nr:radical SAM protein [Deltaproteobacteria bacterium]
MSDEKGSIVKDPGGKLNIALVYPSTYWVGMSNLGMHTMYRVFNDHPRICCERFFLDHERSVETGRPLQDFHIIALSISYELDWIYMIQILLSNKIQIMADRRKGSPVILAGGSAITLNPEPVADAVDVCFLGEGETLPEHLCNAFDTCTDYENFLDQLQEIPGVYLPGRTRPVSDGDTIQGFSGPRPSLSVIDPIENPAHTVIITEKTVFKDMFLLEIARGCPYRCKFCTAREIYSPFRPVGLKHLEPYLDMAASSGKKLGLVSTSLNNHPQSGALFDEINKRGIRVAQPSLRLGRITEDLIDLLKESKVGGVTLAPETGSSGLRSAAGKDISNETILDDVRSLVSSGIRDIKLYFMVGLPGEDDSDIDAVIDLIKRIRQSFIQVSRGNKRLGKLSVSINTMVPKPHTPYERCEMVNVVDARARIKKIVKALKRESNVTVSFEGPKWAYLQALLSRGDRRVLDVIIEMARRDPDSWQEVLRQWPRNPDYYALRRRSDSEILPWSFYSLCRPCIGQ